jgi:hypothetical protein
MEFQMETATYDFSACVKALSSAFALSARALQSELAVSLYVFHVVGGPTLDAKRELRQVYSDAGRPCLSHEDPAYQTVMRRISRSAALFTKIGGRKIGKAVNAAGPGDVITALVELLAPLGLRTMDEVAAYAEPPAAPVSDAPPVAPIAPPRRRDIDAPDVKHVKTRHIDVAVPPGTPARELVTLANKLLALAKQMGAGDIS